MRAELVPSSNDAAAPGSIVSRVQTKFPRGSLPSLSIATRRSREWAFDVVGWGDPSRKMLLLRSLPARLPGHCINIHATISFSTRIPS